MKSNEIARDAAGYMELDTATPSCPNATVRMDKADHRDLVVYHGAGRVSTVIQAGQERPLVTVDRKRNVPLWKALDPEFKKRPVFRNGDSTDFRRGNLINPENPAKRVHTYSNGQSVAWYAFGNGFIDLGVFPGEEHAELAWQAMDRLFKEVVVEFQSA